MLKDTCGINKTRREGASTIHRGTEHHVEGDGGGGETYAY